MIVLAYPDTCSFPTPASPRYHNPIVFISLGGGAARKCCPGQSHPTRKWDTLGQNGTEKTSVLKTSWPIPRCPRGDKRATKGDISATSADIYTTICDKKPPAPRSNVIKCRLLSYILSLSASPPHFPRVRPQTPANLPAVPTKGTPITRRIYNAIALLAGNVTVQGWGERSG